MDGIEVMRRLVESRSAPRLILVSGQDLGVLHSAEKLAQAHGLEVIAALSKPISIESCVKLLRQQVVSQSIKNDEYFIQSLEEQELTSAKLRYAIHDNQMVLHFQPQFAFSSGEIISVESLVRWNHPELGLIYPDRFIPLAEQSGVIGALTKWVIDQAVKQAKLWEEQIPISVNVSAIDVTSLTLPEQLSILLTETNLDPTCLVLELTESALMGELVTSLDILTRLRLKGIELSIDDFGTGFSSLSQLHRVPFTELKIDRSFVMDMCKDDEAYAIVKTCIMLAHELKMKVVAEGVETKHHYDLLQKLGCDIGQGYYFSKPVPMAEMNDILKQSAKK